MRLMARSLVIVLCWATFAHATPYETFVEVDTEQDLYDLLADGQIDQDTFDALIELYQRGVELNSASREQLYSLPNLSYQDVDAIIAYRKESGWIDDPASLVVAGALTERKLYAIASFLVVEARADPLLSADGYVRLWTRYAVDDGRTPPMALRARVTVLRNLTLGVGATLTRNRLGDVLYDPNRSALSAAPADTRLHVPKVFARWETDRVAALAGTYRIGFGQRLTFDNTRQYTPNGIYLDDEIYRDSELVSRCKEAQGELAISPCSGVVGDEYVMPDYRWRDALLGAAVGLKNASLGSGSMQAYAFASHQPHSIYQYEMYDRGMCEDPTDDGDPNCSAPDVYRRGDDPLVPSSRFSFHSLPNMYAETLFGGNLTYASSRRMHVGLTGYRSDVSWLTRGIDLDFQEWSRIPYGGPFGAVGMNLAWGYRWADVFVEATRSFDSTPAGPDTDGGGGTAAVVRGTGTWKDREIEALFRYYDVDFANPHARPISASDEFDGLRARDEVGVRLRYTGVHNKRLRLRATVDVWRQPSVELFKTLVYIRSDVEVNRALRWGLWARFQDKGLSEGGREQCFEVSVEEDERGEPIPCTGQSWQFTGRVRYALHRNYSLTGQFDVRLVDDGNARFDERYRKDVSAAVIGLLKPTDRLRARVRIRYRFEDVSDNQYLEQLLIAYADFTYRLHRKNSLRVRYDVRVWLDERQSTAMRRPSPEHWMWLEFESKF